MLIILKLRTIKNLPNKKCGKILPFETKISVKTKLLIKKWNCLKGTNVVWQSCKKKSITMKIKQAVPIYPVVLGGIVLMHKFNGLYRQNV